MSVEDLISGKLNDFDPQLSEDIIKKAVAGDKEATRQVLEAFEPFIIQSSTVTDENGTYVDEDLAQELRLIILEQTPKFPYQFGE